MTTIKTPDQRLRVFVSSTFHELAAERSAATRAIEKLRLSPILFELGARPHPPRDLYRAYLDQSHIFGIYWASYGWVSPGMAVSGLEDEYDLAGEKPKLIYVKAPSPDLLARALQTLWRGYVRGGTSYTIDGIAELAAAEGAHSVAVRLLAATDAVREASGAPIIPMFAPRFRRAVDGLREAMGPEAFEAEWARGRALGLDGAAKIGLAWARGDDSHVTHDEEAAAGRL